MQDIVPKKSIREITKPRIPGSEPVSQSNTYKEGFSAKNYSSKEHVSFDEYPHKKVNLAPKENSRGWFIVFFLLLLAGSVGTFLHFQKSVTVHLTAEKHDLVFKDTEIVIPAAEITTLTVSTSTVINISTSTGTPTLTKAKGTVTIYNANSTEQPLVAGTRLETPEGKIYRLDAKVTVPKASIQGTKNTPGSIQALITADKAGENYNLSQSDFTFPGLVGSPRYKNVYARTKGSISGGASTSAQIVDEKDKSQKVDVFVKKVTEGLQNELSQKKGSDTFIIHAPAVSSLFEKNSSTSGTVTISSSIFVIKNNTMASLLAKSQKPNENIEMKFASDSTSFSTTLISTDKTDTRIKVSGSTSVSTAIDAEKIKGILAGKSFSQFRELVKQVPGIQEIRFTAKPFWISTFPKSSQINIEEK